MTEEIIIYQTKKFGRALLPKDWAAGKAAWAAWTDSLLGKGIGTDARWRLLSREDRERWVLVALAARNLPWPSEGDTLLKEREDVL